MILDNYNLLQPELWEKYYYFMPYQCREVVDDPDGQGGPVGIGWQDNLGWFLAGSIGDKFPLWSEKNDEVKEIKMEGTIEDNLDRILDRIVDQKLVIKGGTCHGCTDCPEIANLVSDLELLINYIKESLSEK